ncbi:hypothetical protein K1719_012405 [Acacia pycnantha]|nr:hypothetical protein K1719_012405 [Acacia pycnantha]
MSELLRNPNKMKKAQEEVRTVFGSKGYLDESEYHHLKYVSAVMKETLRLHPPLPLQLPRENSESCEINGYKLPAKTKAEFEYIPFGSGRSICPGVSFATDLVEIMLHNLLYHFDRKLPNGLEHEKLDMTENSGATVRRKKRSLLDSY